MSTLIPIENRVENKRAIQLLIERLKVGSKECKGKILGFQGGNMHCDIWWNKKHGFWYYLESHEKILNRLQCSSEEKRRRLKKNSVRREVLFLGLDNPNQSSNLSITVEFSMPVDSLNMQVAGCILTDSKNNIYIGHSGKIGGGRAGIGKVAFTNWYPEDSYPITWGDKTRQLLFIARVKSKTFQSELKTFISRVKKFKEDASHGLVSTGTSSKKTYSKEFSGQRKSYTVEKEIRAKVTHGLVVDALKEKLEGKGLVVYSDRRDLYIEKSRRVKSLIFEIKTDVSSGNLIKAIGQLFYYPAIFGMNANTRRVLVVPNHINRIHIKEMQSLGIKILKYKIGTKVRLYGLDKLLNS